MSRKWTLGLDADDTLWHNERYFLTTQEAFRDLLDDYSDPDHLDERLLAAEIRNIKFYGYGIKGFTLSMIETALEVSNNRVPGHVIDQSGTMGREMVAHPIDLLPGVADALPQLATDHHLIVITKGDL
jgi:putative hydrolase of the HAD superfamily